MARARLIYVAAGAAMMAACSDATNNPITAPPDARGEQAAQRVLGQPVPGLSGAELAQFARGQAVFNRVFTPATGLGPLFNQVSCAGCHNDPIVGGYSDEEFETHATARLRDGTCSDLANEGGPVVQSHVTPAVTAALGFTSVPIMKDATAHGTRGTPDTFGRGLIDAVPDDELISLARKERSNDSRTAGRANIIADGTVGRFGRKASQSSLRTFNSGAFVHEMGITTPVDPSEPRVIGGLLIPPSVDPPGIEVSKQDLDDATAFTRFLDAPPTAAQTDQTRLGSQMFDKIGCTSCHVRTLVTGWSSSPALRNKTVGMFSDLLLHDLGRDNADLCFGNARAGEFRTEPLMGVNHREQFMHDGRAKTVEDAVELHGGQASSARYRFNALSSSLRAALLAYVQTL